MPSLSSQAHGVASRAADSTWLERLTRGGFIGYGVIHLLFAWLAFQIAFGGSSTEGDQSGALQTLAKQPFGTFLIGLIAVGMIAMTVWQGFEAAIGHRGERGGRRVAERVISAGRAVIYLYVAWTGIKILQGISCRASAPPVPTASSRPAGSSWPRAAAGSSSAWPAWSWPASASDWSSTASGSSSRSISRPAG